MECFSKRSTTTTTDSKLSEKKEACNVCMEEFAPGEIFSLQCSKLHRFCKKCITEWWNVCVKNHSYIPNDKIYSCPVCRQYGGFTVLKDVCDNIADYHNSCAMYQKYALLKCMCRHNEAPYGESKYCLNLLEAESSTPTEKLGAIIQFDDATKHEESSPEIRQIGLCRSHCQQYMEGKEIYHYFKRGVVKSEKHKVILLPKPA